MRICYAKSCVKQKLTTKIKFVFNALKIVCSKTKIAWSRMFIFFEAFRLRFIKKDCQNEEHSKGRVFIKGAEL